MMVLVVHPDSMRKLTRMIVPTPNFIHTNIRLFLHAAHRGDPYNTTTESTHVLQVLYHIGPEKWEEAFTSVIAQSTLDVGAITLRHLVEIIPNPGAAVDPQAMLAILFLVVESSRCTSKVHRSLLLNRSVPWMAKVLTLVVSRAQTAFQTTCALRVAYHCSEYLVRIFQEGATWMAQALEGRLLISIFKSSHLVSIPHRPPRAALRAESPLKKLYTDMFQSLTLHLLHESVLRGVVRSIKTLQANGLEDRFRTSMKQGSPLWDAWLRLKQEALQRYEDRTLYRGLNVCHNVRQFKSTTIRVVPS